MARALLRICSDWDRANWLIDTCTDGCEQYPAPIVLRRIYCQKYEPADGIDWTKADRSDFEAQPRRKASA